MSKLADLYCVSSSGNTYSGTLSEFVRLASSSVENAAQSLCNHIQDLARVNPHTDLSAIYGVVCERIISSHPDCMSSRGPDTILHMNKFPNEAAAMKQVSEWVYAQPKPFEKLIQTLAA